VACRPEEAAANYRRALASGDPRIVVIDDLLTPEALEGLQHYCRVSDIRHTAYGRGVSYDLFARGFFAGHLLAIPQRAILRLHKKVGGRMKGAIFAGASLLWALAAPGALSAALAAPTRPAITSVSHLAVYTSDAVRAEHFYVHELGAVKMADPENPQGVRYYFSPVQFVEVLPLPPGTGVNRLDHAAFNTADAEGLRKYLASKKVLVPKSVSKGTDGSQWFQVKDPEGMNVEFVQPPAMPPAITPSSLSSHVIHVGYVIHDRKLEDAFFRDILGFRPYWFGGMRDDTPSWVSQQVPDGSDWLEYMIVGTPDTRGIPATMTQAQAAVLNHFALGVPNMEAVYTMLWNDDRLQGQVDTRGQQIVPKIGRDAKWQLNLLDPDGTRAEVMELHAIGKPCCSSFTASDPEK
jgi:catechol 2,3-dioxygenase-like lactoylglutathione lyase family enzyme